MSGSDGRWVPDSLGTEHLVSGEGERISEHETTRMHKTACGVVLAERVGTVRCVECARRARVTRSDGDAG